MKKNIKPLTPRCGICKRIYSYKNDDGSGLCPRCRPTHLQPLLAVRHQAKPNVEEEAETKMDDFDKQEVQKESSIVQTAEKQEVNGGVSDVENNDSDLKIEDIIEPGRYGVSNSQMIPALKNAIAEQSIEKLTMLKATYFYTFDKSIKYLKKAERNYIATNLK